jgi:NAD(P)-dependent dehydrogenase (short-subunit alcohol dehydrogenase family)
MQKHLLIFGSNGALVKDSAGGSILFTAAYTGFAPEKCRIPYGVSKSSVIYLAETLALKGVNINLSANAIAPFIIDTLANREWMGNNYDFEQLIKPEEIGEVVHSIFLNFRIISGSVIKLPGRLKIK